MDTAVRFDVGTKIGNYEVKRVEWLENLQGTYYELVHTPTGATHIHVDAPDESKAFAVDFPTVPPTSNGVAHILEHVVLAGSEKYNVRDPFFSMISRSASDFMNAMTFSSSTAYPISSRIEKDFYNLLEVYLDAVFFPRITEDSFIQEGHRLEFEETEDSNSGLKIKGVVFNEMKGAMASSSAVMSDAIGKALMPGTTYAENSGGQPENIPDLTWEELKQFHATHYHPSNAKFYTYGDLPLADLLAKIDDLALSRFQKITPDVEIPPVKRFSTPVVFDDVYPLEEGQDSAKKTEVALVWLLPPTDDSFDALCMNVLSLVLVSTDAAPLHRALIDSGLGDALATGSGFANYTKEATFGAGLNGTEATNAKDIEKIILDTLKKVADEGLDKELVEGALHQYELHTREIANTGFPYALRVWFMLKFAYEFNRDTFSSLQMDKDFDRLREKMAAGPYLENLIRTNLLDNSHRALVTVKPDGELQKRRDAAEKEKVAKIEKALSEEDKLAIVARTTALKSAQEADQDTSVLPILELSDIPATVEDVDGQIEKRQGALVGLYEQPTNGLSYAVIEADISGLTADQRGLVGLFADVLTRSGAGEFDYIGQAKRIERFTGGIGAGVSTVIGADGGQYQPILTLAAKALNRNIGAFFDIVGDILARPVFTASRIKQLASEDRSSIDERLVGSGHSYAMLLAGSRLTDAGAFDQIVAGTKWLTLLKKVADGDEASFEQLVVTLEEIRGAVLRRGGLKICTTTDSEGLSTVNGRVDQLISTLADASVTTQPYATKTSGEKFDAVTCAAPVNYCAKLFKTVPFTHPDCAPLQVLGHYLKSHFLHREIREKGGAYGSFSMQQTRSGVFVFLSYRDPNVLRTYEVFDQAVDFAGKTPDPTQFKESILQALSANDPLLGAESRGRRAFFDGQLGYTPEVKTEYKQRLIATTPADLGRVAETYLRKDAAYGVVGHRPKIEEANASMGDIFEIGSV